MIVKGISVDWHRLPITGYKLQVSGYRLSISSYWLPAACRNNLPVAITYLQLETGNL